MNNWMNSMIQTAWKSPEFKTLQKVSDMVDPAPSKCWVLIDERQDSINDGYFSVNMTGWPNAPQIVVLVDMPASYHNQAAGINFAAGHSEIKKWLDPRTMPKLKPGVELTLGVASPNNKDVIWLQERTTGRK